MIWVFACDGKASWNDPGAQSGVYEGPTYTRLWHSIAVMVPAIGLYEGHNRYKAGCLKLF